MNIENDISRLIQDCKEIIIYFTPHMGFFCSVPTAGYTARNPDEFKWEFLDALDACESYSLQKAFGEDCNIFKTLIRLANETSFPGLMMSLLKLKNFPYPTIPHHICTINSMVSYTILEAMLRRLSPIIDKSSGNLLSKWTAPNGKQWNQGEQISGFKTLLLLFETTTNYKDLRDDLIRLKDKMHPSLYNRLADGRNWLLHGNITHSFEGNLVVLLIDLMTLHIIKQDNF